MAITIAIGAAKAKRPDPSVSIDWYASPEDESYTYGESFQTRFAWDNCNVHSPAVQWGYNVYDDFGLWSYGSDSSNDGFGTGYITVTFPPGAIPHNTITYVTVNLYIKYWTVAVVGQQIVYTEHRTDEYRHYYVVGEYDGK